MDWQRHKNIGCSTCGGKKNKTRATNKNRIVFLSTGWTGGTSHHVTLTKSDGLYKNHQTGEKRNIDPLYLKQAFEIVNGPTFKQMAYSYPVNMPTNVSSGEGVSWFTYDDLRVYSKYAKDLSQVFLNIDHDLIINPGGLKE